MNICKRTAIDKGHVERGNLKNYISEKRKSMDIHNSIKEHSVRYEGVSTYS